MKSALSLKLPQAADLFTTQEERDDALREKVVCIPLVEIDPFPDHPFRVRVDETLWTMQESIHQFGVQTPAIVRQKEDGRYEMVSGHRRLKACEIVGLQAMPCIVRELTRDEAIIMMVDSNLQREAILPSEKAKSYKMKMEALNRQGKRTDLTSTPLVSKLRTNEKVGLESGESREQVRRYIRLTELLPAVLDMVDNGKIAMRPAVELSYLPPDQQEILLATIESEDCTPSHVQAVKMRKFAEEGRLNEDVMLSIMQEEKPNQVEQFKMPKERISQFFAPGTPAQKMEEIIVKALEMWRQRERSRNDAR